MNARQAGWSHVELVAAMALLVTGFLGLAVGFHGTSRLAQDSRDTGVLNAGCRNVIEVLRSVPFASVTTEFGPGSGKDLIWCGRDGAISFSDPGDAMASGRIELFDDESSIPPAFEDLDSGFDLNADGTVESNSVSDYKILPGLLTFDAVSASGPRTLTVHFILSDSRS